MTGVLTATDLQEIRDAFTETMPSLCTIKRMGTDADGLSTGEYETIAEGVPCQVRLGGVGSSPYVYTGRSKSTAANVQPRQIDLVYFDGLQAGDHVTVTENTAGGSIDNTYEVLNVPQDAAYLFLVTADAAQTAVGG